MMTIAAGAPRRTNRWLANLLEELHTNHFADIPIKNQLQVRFGRPTKTRLGSISTRRLKGKPLISLITINGLLKDLTVPEYVIVAVLGHEFVHYTHGFHSPLPRLYRYPHQSDVVDKDLRQRGLGQALDLENKWVKLNFAKLYRAHMTTKLFR